MRLTYPQFLMLNHASWCNNKRLDKKSKESQVDNDDDPVVMKGKRLSKLNSEELNQYYSDLF